MTLVNRTEARMKALQSLYQIEMAEASAEEAIDNITTEGDRSYIFHLVNGVVRQKTDIDNAIRPYLKGWTLERISYIDRTILRMGTYELLYEDDLPDLVAINEAVELAKKFGDEKSAKFINGVLSNMMKEKQKEL